MIRKSPKIYILGKRSFESGDALNLIINYKEIMKKYRLLKDLPWMKAGTIVWVENGTLKKEGVILAAECYEATKNYFWCDEDGDFDENAELVGDGWWELISDTSEDTPQIEELDLRTLAVVESIKYGNTLWGIEKLESKLNEAIRVINKINQSSPQAEQEA